MGISYLSHTCNIYRTFHFPSFNSIVNYEFACNVIVSINPLTSSSLKSKRFPHSSVTELHNWKQVAK